MTAMSGQPTAPEVKQCAGACLACHDTCVDAISHCRDAGGDLCEDGHLRLMQECAELCRATAERIQAGDMSDRRAFEDCAEAAARCARSCARFPSDDVMQRCAEACLRVASCCKQLAQPTAVNYDKVVADSFPASDPPASPTRV